MLRGIPDDVTTALHICRGNYRSSWMCEGALEPVAERVGNEIDEDTQWRKLELVGRVADRLW